MVELKGHYAQGLSLFARELRVPGQHDLTQVIEGWPERFWPGTLNVRVDDAAFSARALDSGLIAPLAVLPWHTITGNTLQPRAEEPKRGDAQVWRATLARSDNDHHRACWVLRRIGSRYDKVIELVAAESLSLALDLQVFSPVIVRVHEGK